MVVMDRMVSLFRYVVRELPCITFIHYGKNILSTFRVFSYLREGFTDAHTVDTDIAPEGY